MGRVQVGRWGKYYVYEKQKYTERTIRMRVHVCVHTSPQTVWSDVWSASAACEQSCCGASAFVGFGFHLLYPYC